MSTSTSEAPREGQNRVLQSLRIALHVMFAFLLLFGLVRYIWGASDTPSTAPAVCAIVVAVLLGTVYMVGTVWENRYARAVRAGRRPSRGTPRRFAPWWLACVTLLWFALLLISGNFVWVVFPLMFLFLHLLRLWQGIIAVIILWIAASLIPVAQLTQSGQAGQVNAGGLVGPFLGAVLAIVISTAYRALHEEALHHLHVAEALRLTQDELAEKEHQSGRLEERERLAREIHDTVAQGLSSIVLMSRAASSSLADMRTEEAAARVKAIGKTASESLDEARRFVKDLSSPELSDSVIAALTAICERTQDRATASGSRLRCELRVEGGDATTLPEPVGSALVRAAQGSLANVLEHAEASIAVVTLAVWDAEVTLDIFDDGRGFAPDRDVQDIPSRGYGIKGLQRRLETLGGSLSIDSSPGEGTALGIRIPLTSALTPSETPGEE
ncbi:MULTISPECIES: sensor histidine kinase [Micrococcales]|uniref:sensor histidine kinase n=1 Tax=Micrococcales TaxID=85006 RepID=UPI00068D5B25|nr:MULTISPECIES: sensor histidine kinase [Micrococcales]